VIATELEQPQLLHQKHAAWYENNQLRIVGLKQSTHALPISPHLPSPSSRWDPAAYQGKKILSFHLLQLCLYNLRMS
jgi:hypothetical protein